MSDINLRFLTFPQIKAVWEEKLWPTRTSEIEPISVISMPLLHNDKAVRFDMRIKDIDQDPFFVGAYDGDKLIGVNSGFLTSYKQYRSRGLYVEPEYRGQGIAQILLREVMIEAMFLDCEVIWTMPRKTAIRSYEAVGFEQCSPWFDEGVETGPNCYAKADPWNNKFVRSVVGSTSRLK